MPNLQTSPIFLSDKEDFRQFVQLLPSFHVRKAVFPVLKPEGEHILEKTDKKGCSYSLMKHLGRFLAGGILLSLVSLLIRSVGVFFNAFITTRVGAAATGLYQLVLSVYSPALTLATAGVNLAASRLTAEELGKGRRGYPRAVLFRCLLYAATVSTGVGILLYTLSPMISGRWLGTPDAASLLRLLSAGLPFIALSSAMNGYFTAIRRVSRLAAVQLLEQFFKIALTLLLLFSMKGTGIRCLIVVVFSSVMADLFSCLVTAFLCHRVKGSQTRKARTPGGITSRILAITLPVSVSSFLRSGLVALEHLLIPRGLKKSGIPYEKAMASYGVLSGMAMPILLFPASFLYSFTGLLIPELAEEKERGETLLIARQGRQVLGVVLTFGIGAAGILWGFADELCLAVYQNGDAAFYLSVLAPLIPIMYLDSAVDAMLKGLGEQVFTMKVNVLDALVSVVAVFFLVPRLGLMGYVTVIVVSEMINFSFSLWRLRKVTGMRCGLCRRALLPLLSVIGAVAVARLLSLPLTSNAGIAVVGIACAVICYLFFLVIFGVLPFARLRSVIRAVAAAVPRRRRDKGINAPAA